MLALEVIVATLVCVLLIVVSAAGYIGALGVLGAVRFVRCPHCGHLGLTSTSRPVRSCSRCRHGILLHPIRSLHRASVHPMQYKHFSSHRLEAQPTPVKVDQAQRIN